MKEIIIGNLDDGQRFDRYLVRFLPGANKSFIYKMLRKKNITLNNKKADGSEKITEGDSVKIFFSDETFEKFSNGGLTKSMSIIDETIELDIVYENKDMIFINKPSGMLSQKAKAEDVSLVEYLTQHLINSGELTQDDLKTFRPGICNRLDRNTSGIVAAGKTLKGLQQLSEYFKERTLGKYYICIVNGTQMKRQLIDGYLYKNDKINKVTIYKKGDKNIPKDSLEIKTEYIPVADNGKITLLKVHLHTGRTHQIRAHLASINHSLVGDYKYGLSQVNDVFKKKYGVKDQLLHSYELDIPDMDINIKTKIPTLFLNIIKGENLCQPGVLEDLEVLH